MTNKDFKLFDPKTADIETIPDQGGNYLLVLRNGSELPDIGITPHYKTHDGHRVIYTGISQSSLRKRDFRQHFHGNAGGSTLRKSLGCLFGYPLIPRSKTGEDRKTTLRPQDEERLSDWMHDNLLLYCKPDNQCATAEEQLIKEFDPPLNLSKVPNPSPNTEYRNRLKQIRKAPTPSHPAAHISAPTPMPYTTAPILSSCLNSGKYRDLWRRELPRISALFQSARGDIMLDRKQFAAVGNRKSYRFLLRYGTPSPSAVGRDLQAVLEEDSRFRALLQKGFRPTFRMGSNFILHFER